MATHRRAGSAKVSSKSRRQKSASPFSEDYDMGRSGGDAKERAESLVGPTEDTAVRSAPTPLYDPQLSGSRRIYDLIGRFMGVFNFLSTDKAFRAREWCDLDSTPVRVRQTCQNVLTAQWTRHLCMVQPASPAEIACGQLARVIDEVAELDDRELEVFEFCAGSGGPTPFFEKIINEHRTYSQKAPLQFSISDICPNPEAWKGLVKKSKHLRTIEESVDAAAPPTVALSHFSRRTSEADPKNTSENRILRLFNLSFHHFDDLAAVDILRSTMKTADGVAIIELQDRSIGCLAMLLGNAFFVPPLITFWQPPPEHQRTQKVRNFFRNIATYLRVWGTLCWDGVASCLRTREFEEFIKLAEDAAGVSRFERRHFSDEYKRVCNIGEWEWREHKRVLHTIPYGYTKIFSGIRRNPE
ncbi:hypothetical protein P280DRAFT_152198 [Massarina eburnea CBS 473.64]|uniref:Uncharacterized protein n=1 Tax=Massarina eburnea CBS 473.64 TaxID=1395130 RepID=A0A6A6RMT1_9PLEO|nr:hypothetical protein P280DRAFT_152198 [Massarina eburnea CBS 473.64]